jgi:hypothetical protein
MGDGFQLQIDDEDNDEETGPQPKTLKEAVEVLLGELPPETLAEVRELKLKDIINLHFGLGLWIRNRMLWGNSNLCEAVLNKPGDWLITPGSPDEAWEPIVKALRRRLRADQKAAMVLAEKPSAKTAKAPTKRTPKKVTSRDGVTGEPDPAK